MKKIILLAFILFSLSAHAQIITTVAGDSTEGYNGDSILATTAELNEPTGVALDSAGNLYIVDRGNERIRKVNASTGIITTIAGNGHENYSGDSGLATLAEINYPYDIVVDTFGNIFFSDDGNARIRKIDTAGIITTIAGNGTHGYNGDSIATSAELYGPSGIAIDRYGNIYVADYTNNRVFKISPSGIMTTVAGTGLPGYSGDNGIATAATLLSPNDVKVDGIGNLYIADYSNDRVRKVDTSGIITTIVGTRTVGYNGDNINADSAELNRPLCVATDGSENLYISDTYNQRVRKVGPDGIITTIAGDGIEGYSGDNGSATSAELGDPVGLAIDHSGAIYIVDANRIRRVGWPASINYLPNNLINLKVYPNPAPEGRFTIYITSNINDPVIIVITNMLGEKINELSVIPNKAQNIQIDAPSGIYLLSARGERNISNVKISVIK